MDGGIRKNLEVSFHFCTCIKLAKTRKLLIQHVISHSPYMARYKYHENNHNPGMLSFGSPKFFILGQVNQGILKPLRYRLHLVRNHKEKNWFKIPESATLELFPIQNSLLNLFLQILKTIKQMLLLCKNMHTKIQ